MKTEEPTYLNFTPIELWRLGVKNSPRIDKVRIPPRPPGSTIDIQTYVKNGQVMARAGTGGVSLFDGKNPRLDGIHWWRIPANSTIPPELKITKNHTDRITGFTHYRIEPIFDMPIFHFIYLLTIFAKNAKNAFLTSQEHETVKS